MKVFIYCFLNENTQRLQDLSTKTPPAPTSTANTIKIINPRTLADQPHHELLFQNRKTYPPAATAVRPSTTAQSPLLQSSTMKLIRSNKQLNICVKNANGQAIPLKLTGQIFQLASPSRPNVSSKAQTKIYTNSKTTTNTTAGCRVKVEPPDDDELIKAGEKNPPIMPIFAEKPRLMSLATIKTEPIDDYENRNGDHQQMMMVCSTSSSIKQEVSNVKIKMEVNNDVKKKECNKTKILQLKRRYVRKYRKQKQSQVSTDRLKRLLTLSKKLPTKRSLKYLILSYRARLKNQEKNLAKLDVQTYALSSESSG